MIDGSPFQFPTEVFQAECWANLSLERPDGSIVLILSNEHGVVAKRLIRPAQPHDLEQLQRMIESIHFDIIIEDGTSASQLLQAMTQDKVRWPIAI